MRSIYDNLHLGCGDKKLKNYLNIDCRKTIATDEVIDCPDKLTIFSDKCFSIVFSCAFFEHLYYDKRIECLKQINRILKEDGFITFIGIPDFEIIAKAYINKEKGITSEVFDLFNVYRYTHGFPESAPNHWIEQLHKSLFDKQEVLNLLKLTGFNYCTLFNYCFMSEQIPLNLGFIAFKNKPKIEINKQFILDYFSKITGDINFDTLEIKYFI